MKSIEELLGCGQVKQAQEEYCVDLTVTKLSNIHANFIPFFKKYPLLASKTRDFIDFCKAAELIKNKSNFTSEGLDEMIIIKAQMNTGRYLYLPFQTLLKTKW